MTDLARQIRERFVVDDSIVSVFSEAESGAETMAQRTALWTKDRGRTPRHPEYLLPRIVRAGERRLAPFMADSTDRRKRSKTELEAEVERLAPWGEVFWLDQGVNTMPADARSRNISKSRIEVRLDLITATVADLLGDDLRNTSILDVGCKNGYFSMDIAARGAGYVDGVDLREENIAQARFVAGHFGIDNVTFSVSDAAAFDPGREWDVVFNLGVLYHVTDPVQLLRQTYALTRRFAIVDTLCHLEPVSAYMLVGDKDVTRGTEGREPLEFLPTYRAAIDTLHYVGFSDVFEIVGPPDIPHATYAAGKRRCFLAIK